MSLLTTFVVNQLIKNLESQFIEHEPELKDAFVKEIAAATEVVASWVNSKLSDNKL